MTVDDLAKWAAQAPAGTMIPASEIAAWLADRAVDVTPTSDMGTPTWREKLWTVPAETRLGIDQLCEALDRPRSFAYRHTSSKSGLPLIPHRKLDGALVFIAGEVRNWIHRNEKVVVAGPLQLMKQRKGA